jgi:hypothetical protein
VEYLLSALQELGLLSDRREHREDAEVAEFFLRVLCGPSANSAVILGSGMRTKHCWKSVASDFPRELVYGEEVNL